MSTFYLFINKRFGRMFSLTDQIFIFIFLLTNRGDFWSHWADCGRRETYSWTRKNKEASWARKVWTPGCLRGGRGRHFIVHSKTIPRTVTVYCMQELMNQEKKVILTLCTKYELTMYTTDTTVCQELCKTLRKQRWEIKDIKYIKQTTPCRNFYTNGIKICYGITKVGR